MWLIHFGNGISTVKMAAKFEISFPLGFGEAGFTSIAPTVLGDLFQDSKRTIVLALFYFAIPFGRYEVQ